MDLNEILSRFPREETRLIDLLLEVQKEKKDHFISRDEIRKIADYIGVSEAKVCGVISFYTLLSSEPRGTYVIQVCRDIPCHVNKQSDIVSTLEQILGIRMGETTANGLFSLEYASCLGHCDASPAMRIDGRTYVHLTPDKVKAIVAEYRGKIR
jgi:NADH-quinone oxidoreductase subunit E